jgi:rhodanese-related sulfurtransferase
MIKLIVAASLSSFLFGLFGVDWETVDRKIEDEYPDVSMISSDQLLLRIGAASDERPLLIDVREADEFNVSHLPGALHLQTGQAIAELVRDTEAPIVVYCSVGYRSAGVADELQALGYSNVLNLQHSIFEWANRDLPLLNGAGETDLVHPFNRAWGTLLDESLRSFTPENFPAPACDLFFKTSILRHGSFSWLSDNSDVSGQIKPLL